MKNDSSKSCLSRGDRQLEVALIDLHIRQLRAAISEYQKTIEQLKERRGELSGDRHRKRRRPRQWDNLTPLRDLVSLAYDNQFKTMMAQWKTLTDHTFNPYKAYSFQFRLGDVGRRAVYVPLARFLSPDGRQLRVSAMDFYRYLSVHSNLGSVISIKTGLSRARKWLQQNAEGAK